jgi:dCTP deaminase
MPNQSLLSYNKLIKLVEQGVITANPNNVNGSSIDITLHHLIRLEDPQGLQSKPIDISRKENISTIELDLTTNQLDKNDITNCGYILHQDEFVLASSFEFFNLPDNISAEYKLKSSMARNALEHLNAGWCDATWNESRLTLELKNVSRYHKIILRAGMPIGQIVFFEHEPVPDHKAYKNCGQYNGQQQVTESKGIRLGGNNV